MSGLTDAVTIITGASSGIGAAAAKRLAADGARLVLAARNEDRLDALFHEIATAGGTAVARVTDVTDLEDVRGLAAFAIDEYGRVDILVNNAGLMQFSYWQDTAVEDWRRMVDTNIHGYLNAIAAVLPTMLEQESGHILNMSSVAGHSVGAASGVYSATKFFIHAITDSLRKEVGVGNGIRASMVSPGVIDTGWEQKVQNEEGRKIAAELKGQAITAEQVAAAVSFALNQPADVNIGDIVVAPTRQDW